jgi:DNA-binding NarL/FixJ family response regulator
LIKVLLAEDHNIVRNGIRSLLSAQSDITVVAEATNGLEVLELLDNGLEIDLLLSDINMPSMSGISMVEELARRSPDIKVLILSMLDHENYVLQAVSTGASGYLLKSVSEQELIFAIRHVVAGNVYVCSELTEKILSKLSSSPNDFQPTEKADVNLSKREQEILLLIAEGLTNNEIAERLFTSRRTVEGHRQNLLEKTGARNTATLIRYAVRNGLID